MNKKEDDGTIIEERRTIIKKHKSHHTPKKVHHAPKPVHPRHSQSSSSGRDSSHINTILVENFVNLQKAVTNLALKFESLSDNMTKLLQLFEISARSFGEKLSSGAPDLEKDREFLDKLNKLLEQNKVIAKGLTLMEEKIRGRLYGGETPQPRFQPQAPRFQQPPISGEGYLPSIERRAEEQNE